MIKLNIGCGDFYAPGWVNIDEGTPHRVDLRVSAFDLNQHYGPTTVNYFYCGHILEHVTKADAKKLLVMLNDMLVENGEVLVVGPDIARARATGDEQVIKDVVEGGCRWPGDAHLWTMTGDDIVALMYDIGYGEVTEIPISRVSNDWPVVSRIGWQFAVHARK